MITIKSNSYGELEKLEIKNVFEQAFRLFIDDNCHPSVTCSECPYRHLCYDLAKAREHANKLAYGGDSNEER